MKGKMNETQKIIREGQHPSKERTEKWRRNNKRNNRKIFPVLERFRS